MIPRARGLPSSVDAATKKHGGRVEPGRRDGRDGLAVAPVSFGSASIAGSWLGFPDPLIEPDMRVSRIRLSDWFHDPACDTAGRTSPAPGHLQPLGLAVKPLLKPPEIDGVLRPTANLLSSAPSRAPRTRAPSLHRHYPASSVIWAPPTPTSAYSLPEWLRVSDSLASMGLPCCDALCLYVPPPLPRRVTRKLGGCTASEYSGLPRVIVGSALATALSGPAQGSLALRPADLLALLTRAVVRVAWRHRLPESRPPVATRLYRQLPRQDFHLQEHATFHGAL